MSKLVVPKSQAERKRKEIEQQLHDNRRKWMVRAELVAQRLGICIPGDIAFDLWAVPILEELTDRLLKLEDK